MASGTLKGRGMCAAAIAAALFVWWMPAAGGRAQTAPDPVPLSTLVGLPDPQTAIDSDYGRRMIERMATIIADSASPACLAGRKLDKTAIAARLREQLADWVRHLNAMTAAVLDSGEYEKALTDQVGAAGLAEWRRLLADPRIAPMRAASTAATAVQTVDLAVDHLDRVLVLERIRLRRQLSPLATGDDDMLRLAEGISQQAQEAVEARLGELPADLAQRYRDLVETAAAALLQTTPRLWAHFGPRQMVPGALARLAALCIPG